MLAGEPRGARGSHLLHATSLGVPLSSCRWAAAAELSDLWKLENLLSEEEPSCVSLPRVLLSEESGRVAFILVGLLLKGACWDREAITRPLRPVPFTEAARCFN